MRMSDVTLESVFETVEKILEQDDLPEAFVCVMASDIAFKVQTQMNFPIGTMTSLCGIPVLVSRLMPPGAFKLIPRASFDALLKPEGYREPRVNDLKGRTAPEPGEGSGLSRKCGSRDYPHLHVEGGPCVYCRAPEAK
jgi:hypothetical protein